MSQPDAIEEAEWRFAFFSVWALSQLRRHETSVLDCPIASGIAIKRVNDLYNAYIQPGERAPDITPARYSAFFKALKKTFPHEDPVLLFWRVRYAERSASLARPHLRAPRVSSSDHPASVAFGFHPSVWATIDTQGRKLRDKIRDQGTISNLDWQNFEYTKQFNFTGCPALASRALFWLPTLDLIM